MSLQDTVCWLDVDVCSVATAYDAIRPQLAEVTAKLSPAQTELGELKPRTQRRSFTWLYENLAQ